MKNIAEKAFTLVELLIVIGIIGVLSVTLIVGLNPAEAQRKSRDVKRLADMQKWQSILTQALDDGAIPSTNTAVAGVVNSSAAGAAQQQLCQASNFLGVSLCTYTNTLPLDPNNGRSARCIAGNGTVNNACLFAYYIRIDVGLIDYEINMRMESTSNRQKLQQDGGNSLWMYELFTNNNALIGNAVNP